VLRLTPGAFSAQLLEHRPGGLPTELYQHGGTSPTVIDAIQFENGHAHHQVDVSVHTLKSLRQGQVGLWVSSSGCSSAGFRSYTRTFDERSSWRPVIARSIDYG
jgi:hypothetical protein